MNKFFHLHHLSKDWTECRDIIISAKDEIEARHLAQNETGDFRWLDPEYVRCKAITPGKSRVILTNQN